VQVAYYVPNLKWVLLNNERALVYLVRVLSWNKDTQQALIDFEGVEIRTHWALLFSDCDVCYEAIQFMREL
jgi:hypothetical protein